MDQNFFDPATQPDGGELASKMVSLLSVGAMSMLFGIKTFNVQFKYLTYSRWLVLLLYIISWGFTCAGMLFVTTNNGTVKKKKYFLFFIFDAENKVYVSILLLCAFIIYVIDKYLHNHNFTYSSFFFFNFMGITMATYQQPIINKTRISIYRQLHFLSSLRNGV